MNRRGFLHAFGLGVAAIAAEAVLDPERLLWVPGAKKIFLPPPPEIVTTQGWLANGFALTVGDVITIEGMYAINPRTGRKTKHPQQFVVSNVAGSNVEVFPKAELPRKPKVQPLYVGETVPLDSLGMGSRGTARR